MREILFRGKRKDNGEWIEGYFVYTKSDYDTEEEREADIIPHDADRVYTGEYNYAYPCIPETVGQYTGLTDKNGQKIFEGDVLKNVMRWCEEERNGLVTFKDGAFGFIWHRGEVEMFHAFVSVVNIEYEVIGNINDNPELLEVK